jgi:protein NirF
MKLIFIFTALLISACATQNSKLKLDEKIYVVEREREALFSIENGKEKIINELGNLNHATMKFKGNFGYLLARDGFVSKIDTKTNSLVKKVKIGKSGIGITFINDLIAVVNYAPNSVVILDLDLNMVTTIETNSRNVGIKTYKNLLVFSLMDLNQIWVLDSSKKFEIIKKFENVGNLPFDALIKEDRYVVGFFNEAAVGILNLSEMNYKKIALKDKENNLVYKVPHFGYWGVVDNRAIVPIVAEKKLLVLDLKNLNPISEIKLNGNPVFATLSPDKSELVVNYSGDYENYISIVDIKTNEVKRNIEIGKRVMHVRYSQKSDNLYLTSYFDNSLKIIDSKKWNVLASYKVATPSGIFLSEMKE